MRSAFGAFVFVAAVACTQPAPAPPAAPTVDTAAVTQAIGELWNRIIVADTANNIDAFLAEFAPSVRLDIQGFPPLLGRAAFDSLARPVFAVRDYIALQPMPHTTIVVSNDLALQGGTYTETFVEKKKTSTEYGRFATSAARGADGQFRVVYWMAIIDSTVAAR